MMNYVTPLLAALLLSSATAEAEPSIATPAQVSAVIEREGAQAFLSSLNYQQAEDLYEKIGTGDAGWVALAPTLATGADGANAMGLSIALAYALPKNPTEVLNVVDPVEGDRHILAISRVCGIPFIEVAPKNYKVRALRAVSAVKAVSPAIKRRCLDTLRKS